MRKGLMLSDFKLRLAVKCTIILFLMIKAHSLTGQASVIVSSEVLLDSMEKSSAQNHLDTVLILGFQALKEKHRTLGQLNASQVNFNVAEVFRKAGFLSQADSLYRIALSISEEREEQLDIYAPLIAVNLALGNMDESLQLLKSNRALIGVDTNSIRYGEYHIRYSRYHSEKWEFGHSVSHLLKAKKLCAGSNYHLGIINNNLAIAYGYVNDLGKAGALHEENYRIAKDEGDAIGEMYALYGMQYIALERKEYAKVKEYSAKAFKLHNTKNVRRAFGYAYYMLGEVLLAEGKLDSARLIFQQGIDYCSFREEKKELGENLKGMAKVLYAEGDNEGMLKAVEASNQANLFKDTELIELLADYHEKTGDFEKANLELKAYIELIDKQREDQQPVIASLLDEFLTTEKEKERQVYQRSLEQQRIRAITIFTTLGVLALVYFLFQQIRYTKKEKHLNQQLRNRNKVLNQYTYIASHDLKEMIRNINTFAGLSARGLKKDPPISQHQQLEYLQFITTAAKTLNKLVESLKVFTDSITGKAKRRMVVLDDVFAEVKHELKDLIHEKQAKVSFSRTAMPGQILFSHPMLVLVLKELICNALLYNDSASPFVNVEVSLSGDNTKFRIEDNGRGIDPAFQAHIFEPFKSLDNKTITHASGLGLSTCKNIVERFGGKIGIESSSTKGTVFYFIV